MGIPGFWFLGGSDVGGDRCPAVRQCAALQWLASVWPHEVKFSWEKQDGFVEIPGFWFLGGNDVGGTGAQQRSSAWIFGGRQVCP